MSVLPNGWSVTKIGELADVSRGSSPRPIADQRYFEGGNIPWIKIADATRSGKYLYDTKEKVNEFGASFSRLLPAGSLIVAASGTLGYTQILGVPGCVHDGWLYLTNFRGIDKDFLYYFLHWKKQHFYNSAYGAAIQNINTEILRNTAIALPPLPTQERIGSILSTYDDLIDRNARRIEILEAMTQMIYREWFVNFRFPDHAKVKLVKSEVGSIPESWRVEPLRELTTLITRGISPQYNDEATGLVINQKCIRNGRLSLKHARRQSKKVPDDRLLCYGDVLINSTGVGTLGRVAQVLEPMSDCTVDSHVTIVRPRINSEFLGKALLRLEEHFERLGTGSTGQTELSRERIGSTEVLVPTPDLQEQFSRVVAPINKMILCCLARNANLHETRDLLLPRMISGEISAEHFEQETVAKGV